MLKQEQWGPMYSFRVLCNGQEVARKSAMFQSRAAFTTSLDRWNGTTAWAGRLWRYEEIAYDPGLPCTQGGMHGMHGAWLNDPS